MATKTESTRAALHEIKLVGDAEIDSLEVMELAARYFRQRAMEERDPKIARKNAREADRMEKTLARYRPGRPGG